MKKNVTVLTRYQINADGWDACVAASPQRIVYGYSWYLDAVLPAPDWKWVGLILTDEKGNYRAVMPVPLRRKRVASVTYAWVVHQPFFCQFLAVFSSDEIDPMPFLMAVRQHFRYASTFCVRQKGDYEEFIVKAVVGELRRLTTHTLHLTVGYEQLFEDYSRDRKLNLRRAKTANWTVIESTNLEPLLTLFRKNHADHIDGGVAEWAYDMFINLTDELRKRGFLIVRYASLMGQIEAGAVFVQEGNRIIYLFNAASEVGRKGNARTLLIDQIIRENAGKQLVFDFESPAKPSIIDFYRSFGAIEEPFLDARWNRLNVLERGLLTLKNFLSPG